MSDTTNFFDNKKRWSTFKDQLLDYYLTLYFPKILSTGKDTLFIDGFAGQGVFKDGTIGSPIIVRDKAALAMERTKFKSKIIPIFVEFKKKNVTSLVKNLNCDWCYVLQGDYKEKVREIITKDKNLKKNIFLYVDPFGIKHIQFDIFQSLAKNPNSVELLMNLSSFGFIREGCRLLGADFSDGSSDENEDTYDDTGFVNDITNMNSIAHGTYWQEIIEKKKKGDLSGLEAERLFVEKYMNELQSIFKYVFQVPIKTGDDKMPKYRMVYATNNIQGALLMSENMIKCNNDMNITNHGFQTSIFDYDYKKINCKDDLKDVLKSTIGVERWVDCAELYLLLNKTKGALYLHKDYTKALHELEDNSIIEIEREEKYTSTGKVSKALDFIKTKIKVKLK